MGHDPIAGRRNRNHRPRHFAHCRRHGTGDAARSQGGAELFAGLVGHRVQPDIGLARAFAGLLVQMLAHGLPGRLLGQRLGPQQLVKAGIARIRWPQGDGGNAVEALAELLGGSVVAADDGRQLLAEQLQVQLAGAVANAFGVDLLGHRFDHPLVVLLLQVQRQALFRRLPAFTAVDLVPGHLEGQPLLGPVAGKPRDEVAFGTLLYLFLPHPHGTACIVVGRAAGADRGFDQFLVDALPGGGGEHHRWRRDRWGLACATGQGQQQAQ